MQFDDFGSPKIYSNSQPISQNKIISASCASGKFKMSFLCIVRLTNIQYSWLPFENRSKYFSKFSLNLNGHLFAYWLNNEMYCFIGVVYSIKNKWHDLHFVATPLHAIYVAFMRENVVCVCILTIRNSAHIDFDVDSTSVVCNICVCFSILCRCYFNATRILRSVHGSTHCTIHAYSCCRHCSNIDVGKINTYKLCVRSV